MFGFCQFSHLDVFLFSWTHSKAWFNILKLSLSFFSSFFFHSILITASLDGSVQHMDTRVKLNHLSFGHFIPVWYRFTVPNSSLHIFFLLCLSAYLPSWPYLILWTTCPQHYISACRTIRGHNAVYVCARVCSFDREAGPTIIHLSLFAKSTPDVMCIL